MTQYCDINDNWTFNDENDLTLTNNYIQSLTNRFQCPKDYLNIYYNDKYGSELTNLLGDNYNEEHARLIIKETLDQDTNIITYTINHLNYTKGDLTVNLTIDGVEIILTLQEGIE
jgi:hypothetical protein